MRRIVSYVLVLLGVFAIALAFLLKLYAYPRLAKVPHDVDSVTVAQGSGITALEIIKKDENDPGEPVINHNLNLTSITHVTPNLREPEVSKDSQVTSWTEASLVTDDNKTTVIDGKAQPL